MKHMSLTEIASACRGTYHGDNGEASKEISSVTIDSRKIEKDCLFIALKGARSDGHDFIPQTMENRALCALSEKDLGDTPYPYILVDSCRQALEDLAEHYRRSLDIKVVGITGSVGKTSTKEMVASILSRKFCVLKTAGNFNNEIGLPLTIFNIREEHEIAVLEMGISDFGEMERLSKAARPDICIFTNIGYSHLEQLKSRDGILKAKTEMLQYMNPNGSILYNGDDDKLAAFTPENGIQPVYFGLGENCRFRAGRTDNQGLHGTTAEFITPNGSFTAHIPIPGEHMVLNALAGTAAGTMLGLTMDEIKAGIEALDPLDGRNHLIETGKFTIIDDCYNANPGSMKASLDVLAQADTRTAAILGDMGELGDNWKELHRQIGRYATELRLHLLVCIGEKAAEIANGALETVSGRSETQSYPTAILHYNTKADFFKEMESVLAPGDTVLVKASHMMKFSEIVERLQQL